MSTRSKLKWFTGILGGVALAIIAASAGYWAAVGVFLFAWAMNLDNWLNNRPKE